MALGDLVTADYMFEYNGLAIGATTDYDLVSVSDFLGFSGRSQTVDRFGRHGGSSGRHYSNVKFPTFVGNISAGTDTDFETKRQALASAFGVVTNPLDAKEMVTMLPGSGSLKVQTSMRPLDFTIPLVRSHALKYAPYIIRFEMPDPILQALISTTTVFSVPTDTEVITNNGNAPAAWSATLVGPAENPSITNNDTGQVIAFDTLTVLANESLVFDSFDSSVKLNGVTVSKSLNAGFSWFDLSPDANSISFAATNAASASFSLTFRDSYWIF